MILKYGSYSHGDGTCAVQMQRTPKRDSTGRRFGYTERWTVDGWIIGTGPSDLAGKIATLEAAYASDGQSLGLYDGATSIRVLNSSASVGGCRVIEAPSYPEGGGPEYANRRSFRLTVEADFQDGSAANLEAFQESVTITGTGGSRFVTLVPLDGLPIQQTVNRRTPVQIVQSGSAMGLASWPLTPSPLFNSFERLDRRQITRAGPERQADGSYRHYGVSWTYEFELPAYMTANPHLWGV